MADEINVKVILDPSQVQAGSADVVTAINKASADIQSSLQSVTKASNTTAAAVSSGFAGVTADLKGLQSQMSGVAAAIQQSGQSAVNTLNQVGAAGSSAAGGLGRTGHAAAGVRRELLVLAHEASQGQWTRFGGSIMVLGERMDWLRYLTGPTGVAIGVLVGTLGAFAVAAIKGAAEINHLNNELALTGNASGLTGDKYLEAARKIADGNALITMGGARNAVSAVAATGAFGPGATSAVAAAVSEISRLSGETEQKVAESFAKMEGSVYKWAQTSKEAQNLVSAAELEHIRTLEEQGRAEEAEIYVSQRISERLKQVETDLGILPTLWNEVKRAASDAWDAMMGIGRPDTLSEQITKLEARRKALSEKSEAPLIAGEFDSASTYDSAAALDKQIAALRARKKAQDDAAKADATQAENNRDNKKGAAALDAMATRYDRNAAKAKELAEAQQALNSALKGLPEPAKRTAEQIAYATRMQKEYDQAVAGINARGPKAKTLGAAGAYAAPHAEDMGELALLKDRLQFEQKILQTSYKDGEITLKQYYDARMQIVRQGMAAEVQVAQRGVENAQAAAAHAGNNPNAQQQAQARIVQAKNKLALLNQQLQEQETSLTMEMQEQQDLQDQKLAKLQEEQNLRRVEFNTSQQQRMGQLAVTLGQSTNLKLIQLDMQLEDQRYQVALQGLQRRLGLAHQTVEQQQQINAQIEQLEQQHTSKMTELQIQQVTEQTKLQRQAMDNFSSDLEALSAQLVEKPREWRQAFGQFFTTLDSQLVKLSAESLFKNFAGPGTGAGGFMSGIFGKLFGGATSQNTTATQQIGTATIATAQVPTMTVGTMTVGASVGGAGGSAGGGLSSLLSGIFGGGGDFAGDFGFSSGVEGSVDSVMSGLGNGATEAGATDLSALFGLSGYATGTPYVPQTQLALVHRGEAIIPAAQNSPYASGGMSVVNNFNLPGSTDMRTQQQMAGLAGMAIQTAMRRNS